jgi:hypothetical protein
MRASCFGGSVLTQLVGRIFHYHTVGLTIMRKLWQGRVAGALFRLPI